jgi:hypothetical protein
MRFRSLSALMFVGVTLTCTALARTQVIDPDIPKDIRGKSFVLSGTVKLGGTALGTTATVNYVFTNTAFTIGADPKNPKNPADIEVRTTLPSPAAQCDTGLNRSIVLVGTYDSSTGAISVSGSRTKDIYIDTGIVDKGVLLNNGEEIWAHFADITLTMNGILTQKGKVLTINGTDLLPGNQGPSTNLQIGKLAVFWVKVGDCNAADASKTLPVSNPFGGVGGTLGPTPSWQAVYP